MPLALNLKNLKPDRLLSIYNPLLDALKQQNKPTVFAQYEPLIKKSQIDNVKGRYYYTYGRLLAARGHYKQAMAQYHKALEIKSTYVWSRLMLGYALIKVNKPAEVLTQCETVLKSDSASHTVQAAALCGLAQILLKQPEKAASYCQTALTRFEQEDWAHGCLGDVLMNHLAAAQGMPCTPETPIGVQGMPCTRLNITTRIAYKKGLNRA